MTAVVAASQRLALAALLQSLRRRVLVCMGVMVTVGLVRMYVLVTGRMWARHTVRVESVHREDRRWASDQALATALALANVNILARARADLIPF